LNPLQLFRCSRYYFGRQDALRTAVNSVNDLEMAPRIRRILDNQMAYEGVVGVLTVSGLILGVHFCATLVSF